MFSPKALLGLGLSGLTLLYSLIAFDSLYTFTSNYLIVILSNHAPHLDHFGFPLYIISDILVIPKYSSAKRVFANLPISTSVSIS